MNQSMTPIPPRFREGAFRFYEHTIARILATWPTVIVIDPTPEYSLSPVTFANRLRDAMTSHCKHSWPSAYVDAERLRSMWPGQIVVSERDDGKVLIGSKESLKEVILGPNREAKALTADSWTLDWQADEAECIAVIELCHRRRLLGVAIHITNIPADAVAHWESCRDIAFSPTPERENTYTLT